ncbi:MAG: MATE family efflux transporter [Ruminococcaceae bacterium]|nr:MATE family efflux transporter [Oscillospiraceae bacterium]
MKQKDNLLQGPIWRGLIFFAMPILLGQIFQQLYNTADAWIVGRYLPGAPYAAVTSTGPLVFLLIGFFGGIAVGAGSVIARYYGANDIDKLRKTIHTTVLFGLVAGMILSVIGVCFTPTILHWMGAPKDSFQYSVEYFRYYFLGGISITMYNLCMGILRAVGDSKHPLYYLIISSIINVVLDFLFIAGFGWGVWSAALATTISQFISCILCIWQLFRCKEVYTLKLREMRVDKFHLREIIRFGLPSGIQNSVIAFANVIVQTNINSFDSVAQSACGTYAKLEGFAFLPITCFTMALTTFVSQNIGAKQYDRVKKGSNFGTLCAVVIAEFIGVIMVVFARPLMEFFIKNNPEAVDIAIQQARIESLFFCFLSFSHCIAAILRGAGKPIAPMLVMLGTWCALRVAYISIVVPIVEKPWVIFSAYPLTWTVSSIIYLILYLKTDWIHGFDQVGSFKEKWKNLLQKGRKLFQK